jgi:hypothetical protein
MTTGRFVLVLYGASWSHKQSELLTFLIKDTKYIVTMAQVANNGEIQPRLLPDLPSFLLGRNTHGIIDWIRRSLVRWSLDGEDLRRKCTRRILPGSVGFVRNENSGASK